MKKKSTSKPTISIVIPVFNEGDNLPRIYKELKKYISAYKYEILFVNDGSSDDSAVIAANLSREDRAVKLINFSRNFGQQIAISAGIDFASGDAVIIMDADLQDPPALMPKFIAIWQQGYDVVYGIRTRRKGELSLRYLINSLYYRLLDFQSPVSIPQNVGDFRLISYRVVKVMKATQEHRPFLRGMIPWVGFKQVGIPYTREKRYKGRSKYSFSSLMRMGIDGLVSSSLFPVRMVSLLGMLATGGAIFYMTYGVWVFWSKIPASGWSPLTMVVLILGSAQLLSLGIIGEYLGRIYEQVKKRPLYVVDSIVGFVNAGNIDNTTYRQSR